MLWVIEVLVRFCLVSSVPLPPAELRQGGVHFLDDGAFVASAVEDVERLRAHGLQPESRVLDLGCGPGRFAIGLLATEWFTGSYLGVEVQERHVKWCIDHITSRWPPYRFALADTHNERYRPDGTGTPRLPSDDGENDFFYAYSVFSHMKGRDVVSYLQEIRRVLSPAGRAFVTLFAESGVPDETENPDWYGPFDWRGRLHCVLYSIDWVEQAVGHAGLSIVDFAKGVEVDGQTSLILKRAPIGSTHDHRPNPSTTPPVSHPGSCETPILGRMEL